MTLPWESTSAPTKYQSPDCIYCQNSKQTREIKTYDVKDDLNFYNPASTPKQNDQSVCSEDVNGKDENEVMTDQQEGHGQHHVHVQDYPDESDTEVVLRGFGLVDNNDYSFLFDDGTLLFSL